jgi:hypothetical protein
MKLESEIGLARRSRVPVLISAPPDRAMAVAHAIATGVQGHTPPVVMCDGAAIVSAARDRRGRGKSDDEMVMIVSEVHTLSGFEQAGLSQLLADGAGVGRRRIIATSSASLLDHVEQGTFDETLFYRLNAIHIISDLCSDLSDNTPSSPQGPGGPGWGGPGTYSTMPC